MAKKPETKKEVVETKDVAIAVQPAALTSASLAQYANFDLSQFKDVALDIAENKELFNNDILIPKIWLIQDMSELRKQDKAKTGQFVDSQSEEMIADVGGSFRFIVLKTFKRWHTFELKKVGTKIKKEFLSSEIMVLGKNENLKYEETVEGKDIVRRQVISAYVLLEKDATRGINKPYIIDFASTSKLGGRVMVSDISTLNARGLPSFAGFFEMTAEEENFTEGSAFVKKVKFGGFIKEAAIPFLVTCHKSLASIQDQIVIDDRDVLRGEGEGATVEANVGKKANVASSKI